MKTQLSYLPYKNEKIAYYRQEGQPDKPDLVFFGGFRSDMTGTKAQALATYAQQNTLNYLRFDYFGHGQSSGDFQHGTISHWRDEAAYILDKLTTGRLILVGSSFGGWLASMMATQMPERIQGIVLIAPAIDMTERFIWQEFDEDKRTQLMQKGVVYIDSDYDDESYPITRTLIEDGRQHLMLQDDIIFNGAVRILHGQQDSAVPWQFSLEIAEKFSTSDINIHFVKDGDHSLSRPDNLTLLHQTLDALYA